MSRKQRLESLAQLGMLRDKDIKALNAKRATLPKRKRRWSLWDWLLIPTAAALCTAVYLLAW